jgi:hypothetical protein
MKINHLAALPSGDVHMYFYMEIFLSQICQKMGWAIFLTQTSGHPAFMQSKKKVNIKYVVFI